MKVDGDLIQGAFYEWKLQKVMEKNLSRIENVLVYREIGSKEEVLVHWEDFQR